KEIGSANEHPLIGDHNLENICAALSICKQLDLNLSECLRISFGYQGLPHRLQAIGPINGITYINDSISTDPEATIAALNALSDNYVTLIVGGEDREQNFDALCALIDKSNVNVICAYETGPRIFDHIKSDRKLNALDIEDAVGKAKEITPEGGYIVLSPAAPSYDAFNDFEERGDLFMKLAIS
ncbi:MAG: cyanophycin synthetase, partial [Emcibacteraceae bacterium]|nr:cyanophycin synthetase [Emcibacteraceae bacterium]